MYHRCMPLKGNARIFYYKHGFESECRTYLITRAHKTCSQATKIRSILIAISLLEFGSMINEPGKTYHLNAAAKTCPCPWCAMYKMSYITWTREEPAEKTQKVVLYPKTQCFISSCIYVPDSGSYCLTESLNFICYRFKDQLV